MSGLLDELDTLLAKANETANRNFYDEESPLHELRFAAEAALPKLLAVARAAEKHERLRARFSGMELTNAGAEYCAAIVELGDAVRALDAP